MLEVVVLDRDHQRGKAVVADDAPELLLGLEHPGGGPARAHSSEAVDFDVAELVRLAARVGRPVQFRWINLYRDDDRQVGRSL